MNKLIRRSKDPLEDAAILVQRLYRKRLRERFEAERMAAMSAMFQELVKHKRKTDRNFWRGEDLSRLNRNQLQKLARRLDLQPTGKKQEILNSIKQWVEHPARIHAASIHAASRAADKKSQGMCVLRAGLLYAHVVFK